MTDYYKDYPSKEDIEAEYILKLSTELNISTLVAYQLVEFKQWYLSEKENMIVKHSEGIQRFFNLVGVK